MTRMSEEPLPDAQGEVRKSVIFLTPTVGGNLVALVTLPIFLLFLTPEDYGHLALATAYASVVVGLFPVEGRVNRSTSALNRLSPKHADYIDVVENSRYADLAAVANDLA